MSKKLPKPEDLVEILMDDKIIDIVTARTVSSITPTLQQLFKPMFDSLKLELQESIAKASAETIERRCGVMDERLSCLSEENLLLKKQLNSLEVANNLTTLIIQGIPEQIYESAP